MKIFITTSLCLLIGGLLSAQPVIIRENFLTTGDEIFYSDVPVIPDAGPAGENVIWDFAQVQPEIEIFGLEAVLANTTPYFNDFPQANIALYTDVLGTDIYQYTLIDNSAFQELGYVITGYGRETYDDPSTFLVFPCTYNTQWQDDFSYTATFEGNPTTTLAEGSIQAVVDGYGTLMLPNATFTDVLRVRIVENSTDTTDYGLGIAEKNVNIDTSYHWISPSYHGTLCSRTKLIQQHYAFLITPDTVIVDVETLHEASFGYDPMSGGSATQNVQPGKYALHVSPNPFEKTVQVSFTAIQPDEMQFLLQDLRGNLIYRETLNVQAGDNTLTLSLPDFPAGAYIAFLQSSEGADVQKLIKVSSAR